MAKGKKIMPPPPKTMRKGISKKQGTGYSRKPTPSAKGPMKSC